MNDSVKNRERGFTLVELLIAMALAGIVLGALGSTFLSLQKAYDVQEQISEMVQTTRAAMDMMTREVKMAGYDPNPASAGVVGITYDTGQLQILADLNGDGETDGTSTDDDDNEEIIYSYDDANDQIDRDTGGGDQPFAENIQTFDFKYLKADGVTQVTSSANQDEIRQVKITITARTSKSDPNYGLNFGYRRYTLITLVTPPNLNL
jgi:type IV pilus assembly protein PilW